MTIINRPQNIVENGNKIKEHYKINFSLKTNSRKSLKDQTIKRFLKEKCGYWKDEKQHATSYRYYVEHVLSEKWDIYLLRPTFLNKGIDFQVWVTDNAPNADGDYRPSHKGIFKDLEIKQKENPKQFIKLLQAIDKVWGCEEPDKILKKIKLPFKKGLNIELLLKILKWLFIEQDITYWNYSGRDMLRNGIHKKFSK